MSHIHAAFNGFLTQCPECGDDYIETTVEGANDPDRLCPTCFEKWPGLTIEQLMDIPDSGG